MRIVCDTDFLSSLLKINRLNLVLDFFNVKKIIIPTEVAEEISETNLIKKVVDSGNIKITKSIFTIQKLGLGRGEMGAINLAFKKKNSVFLSNDKKAVEFAKKQKIIVFDLFSFLLACQEINLLNKKKTRQIIKDLKSKDYFEFGKQREKLLLKKKKIFNYKKF